MNWSGWGNSAHKTPFTDPSRYLLEEFMSVFSKTLKSVSPEVLGLRRMILLKGDTVRLDRGLM